MKLGILILWTQDWDELAEVVCPNIQQYCDRHGYTFNNQRFPIPYHSDFGFNKIKAIQHIFEMGDADVVWSLDLDATITNFEIKVEDFIEDGKDFFITKDVHTHNAGSFIVRKSEWSAKFLDYLLAQKGEDGMHCEQNAIDTYMAEFPYDTKIKILPHPSINSYHYYLYPEPECQQCVGREDLGDWQEGNFVIHLPAVGFDKRVSILKNIEIIK